MDRAIRITAGSVYAEAWLNDSQTACAIWEALPLEAKGETWGDEIYFDIGLTVGLVAPGRRRGRGPRLLAARTRLLHLLRADTTEPGRRDPSRQSREPRRPDRR